MPYLTQSPYLTNTLSQPQVAPAEASIIMQKSSVSYALPLGKEWLDIVGIYAENPFVIKIYTLLMHNSFIPLSQTQQRITNLSDICDACSQYLINADASLNLQFELVLNQAQRQLIVIKNALNQWNKIKKFFIDKPHATEGATQRLKHHNLHAPIPTSIGNYWLEKLDPLHRPWGHLPPDFFSAWLNSNTNISFFAWLALKKDTAVLPSVSYIPAEERFKYLCIFPACRRVHQFNPAVNSVQFNPITLLSTRGCSTVNTKNASIWVCSSQKIFYSAPASLNSLHHSSLVSGEAVSAAGEWIVSQGQVLLISNQTGHYACSLQQLLNALRLLGRFVDLTATVLHYKNYVTAQQRFFRATDFMLFNGDIGKCKDIISAIGLIENMEQRASEACGAGRTWSMPHQTEFDATAAHTHDNSSLLGSLKLGDF